MRLHPLSMACLAALLLGGCALGPDFQRPTVDTPAAFRAAEGWKLAEHGAPTLEQNWWERYQDPTLNSLLPQVEVSNQNVVAAQAQYRQALALVAGSRAQALPELGAELSATRSQTVSSASSSDTAAPRSLQRLSLSSSWEIDLWGRISRSIEASANTAQASAADLAAARLSAQATLAQSYLQLRVNDAQQRLFGRTLEAYQRSLDITRNRHTAGVASQADVAQ
ncbi:MAG: TolC family protein, partial [Azoarcus sp.]|nr:TolC family protein [Azoarcus sp.]